MATEKRLIDRNEIFPNGTFFVNAENPMKSLDELIARIWSIPTVDAAEVVRCRDCGYHRDYDGNDTGEVICKRFNTFREPDFYCSYGERKDNG